MRSRNFLRAAAVAISIASAMTFMAPSASAATRLGGISLGLYCQKTVNPGDGSVARLLENHARGWRCLDSVWVGPPFGWATYKVRGMDLNHACRLQYGNGAYVKLEQNHARGWVCYR